MRRRLEQDMADKKPNDRLKSSLPPTDNQEADPKIYLVVDNRKMPRPGLETFFAEARGKAENSRPGCTCDPVGATFCSCNKVCTCVPVCSCVGNKVCGCVPACGCVGHTSSGGSYGGGCRCAPVH